MLAKNTLEAVIQLPNELFQPYASATTAIVYICKGIPHPENKKVFFARVDNDGYRIKKGVRIVCEGSELEKTLDHFNSAESEAGFSGWAKLDEDVSFAPGSYVPARELVDGEIDRGVLEVVRARSVFVAAHGPPALLR